MSIYLTVTSCFFLSTIVTLIVTPFVIKAAHSRGWIDTPGDWRKIHGKRMPNVGGIAIAAGFNAGLLVLLLGGTSTSTYSNAQLLGLWIGSLVVTGFGFYDDVRGIGFKRKFFIQMLLAYGMLWAGFRIDLSGVLSPGFTEYHESLLSVPLTFLWYVGIMNAINLVDGLDGLAGGVAVIAFISLSLAFFVQDDVASVCLILAIAGATTGFLVYNLNPASIFMGDSGSMLLGFLIATFSIQGVSEVHSGYALFAPVVALGFPILDTMLAFFRRLAQGHSPFLPDKDHIHHRLFSKIGSHRMTVFIIHLLCLAFGIQAVLMTSGDLLLSLLSACASLGLMLVTLWLLGYVRQPGLSPATTESLPPALRHDYQNGAASARVNGHSVRQEEVPQLSMELVTTHPPDPS